MLLLLRYVALGALIAACVGLLAMLLRSPVDTLFRLGWWMAVIGGVLFVVAVVGGFVIERIAGSGDMPPAHRSD